ncbi:MAG TPA: hypothetical protein VGP90_06360 [Acidimicrobiia bacterium]|nr:hypothetical protein [Acidimicrobiia bacterium]
MSDTNTATDTGGGLTTSNAPAVETTGAPSAPSAAPDIFGETPNDQAVFDRSYVERLRTEGARYRTEHNATRQQLSAYETAFGGYAPEDRQVWMDLASTWANNPAEAAEMMNTIAQAVLTPEGDAAPETPAEPVTAEEMAGLTPQQVQEMISSALTAQQQQAAEQRAVDEVYSEIRAAGFDPSTKEGFMVLWLANNGGNGDIQAGIRDMQAWRQSIVDEYVTGRSNGHHATPSPNGAVATTQEPIHDLKDARKAAEAYIRAQMGASSG